jgi:hypothetical protein
MTPQFANPIWGLSALLMTALLTLLSRESAQTIGLVDYSGRHKHHEIAVPHGGPAIISAFVLLGLMFGVLPSVHHVGLLGGVLLLHAHRGAGTIFVIN